jgi:hypothetical protein
MSHGTSGGGANKSEHDFPALRDFFSGYLHQDFREEYSSAAQAGAAFCKDATHDQITAVQAEWKAWRITQEGLTSSARAAAIRKLGGAWQPRSNADLDALERALGAAKSDNPQ